jgi:hypothetical protein
LSLALDAKDILYQSSYLAFSDFFSFASSAIFRCSQVHLFVGVQGCSLACLINCSNENRHHGYEAEIRHKLM